MSETDVALRGLTKRFGEMVAVDNLDLDIPQGGFFALLGLSFPSYSAHEAFYLGAARQAGLNGWELDRLLYNFLGEVQSRL